MQRLVLKTHVRVPQANAFCERPIGTMCRDNRARPQASLRPGIPDPLPEWISPVPVGHHLPERCRIVTPILRGLQHEYRVAREAA